MSVIEATDLHKSYGQKAALRGISFQLQQSEVFGFIGPNGAGKTTTIRLIMGLLGPTSGELSVLGSSPRDVDHMSQIGHIPGEFGLWPQMSGSDCLDYLGSLNSGAPSRRDELCELLEMPPRDLNRPTRVYSRGMRQKIAIIQALQHDPKLLVMDEPTEGLDPLMKDRFIELIRSHKERGGTAFFSSHILSEVEECADRVAVIRNGSVIRVADTDSLAKERIRHCVLKLKEPLASDSKLQLPGVSELRVDDRVVKFDFRGDMEPLMKAVAKLPVLEFLAEPESLTEAFFGVYSEEAQE